EAVGIPKTRSGNVEAIRALRVVRRSAVKARTQALLQLRDLTVTAPDELRAALRDQSLRRRAATCAKFRPGPADTVTGATKLALRELGQRVAELNEQI